LHPLLMETGRNRAASPDNPRVAYFPCKDATPEGELAALAAVYRFLLDRRERSDVAAADDAENEAEHGE
jgi:hypothetical protein